MPKKTAAVADRWFTKSFQLEKRVAFLLRRQVHHPATTRQARPAEVTVPAVVLVLAALPVHTVLQDLVRPVQAIRRRHRPMEVVVDHQAAIQVLPAVLAPLAHQAHRQAAIPTAGTPITIKKLSLQRLARVLWFTSGQLLCE